MTRQILHGFGAVDSRQPRSPNLKATTEPRPKFDPTVRAPTVKVSARLRSDGNRETQEDYPSCRLQAGRHSRVEQCRAKRCPRW